MSADHSLKRTHQRTRSDRILSVGMRLWMVAFIAATAYSRLINGPVGGAIMATMLLTSPLLLLGAVAFARIGERLFPSRQPIVVHAPQADGSFAPRPPQGWLTGTRCLVALAVFAVFGITAMLIWGSLAGPHPTLASKALFAVIIMAFPAFLYFRTYAWPRIKMRRRSATHRRSRSLIRAGKVRKGSQLLLDNKKDPNSPEHWALKCQGHVIRGELIEALTCANQAVAVAPKSPAWARAPYFGLRGTTLAALGDYDGAIADWYAALAARTYPPIQAWLGAFLVMQCRPEHAIPPLMAAVKRNDLTAKLSLADAFLSLHRAEEARMVLEDVVQSAPKGSVDNPAAVPLALVLLGRFDEADPIVDELVKADSTRAITARLFIDVHRNRLDDAYRDSVALALRSFGAVNVLGDPRISHIMSERRFRELFVACARVRGQNIAEARRIIGVVP